MGAKTLTKKERKKTGRFSTLRTQSARVQNFLYLIVNESYELIISVLYYRKFTNFVKTWIKKIVMDQTG